MRERSSEVEARVVPSAEPEEPPAREEQPLRSSAVHARRTVIRLVGPSIADVGVALQRLDEGRALTASFPIMRLRAADADGGQGPAVWISARHGAVHAFVDGAADARIAEALSRELACAVLYATEAASSRHEALFDRGGLVWEERIGATEEAVHLTYRVSCAALGLALTVPVADARNEVLAAAWRQIDALADELVGAERMRALRWEGGLAGSIGGRERGKPERKDACRGLPRSPLRRMKPAVREERSRGR